MENLAVTFCYLWLGLLRGAQSFSHNSTPLLTDGPDPPPLKHSFYYYQSFSHNSTRSWGCWLGLKVSTLIGYLLTDGLNCLTQIFSRLAFGIKGCSSKTCFISSIFSVFMHCTMALCTWAYYIHCIFRLCASVCLRISVMKKIKSALNRTFSSELYRNWRKYINILKNNGLFLKNKQKF